GAVQTRSGNCLCSHLCSSSSSGGTCGQRVRRCGDHKIREAEEALFSLDGMPSLTIQNLGASIARYVARCTVFCAAFLALTEYDLPSTPLPSLQLLNSILDEVLEADPNVSWDDVV